MAQQYSVGIDLGTTFSSLAYVDQDGRVTPLRLPDGSFQMASAIYFKSETEIVVGTQALHYAVIDASRVARAFKRQMGNPTYVQLELDNRFSEFAPDGRSYRPEDLSAMVLRELLQLAGQKIGPIERAVISVPFVFDEKRRQATRDAGMIAGLKEVDIVDEPVAAAIAYGHMLVQDGGFDNMADVYLDETVLVYDLGGGTFDVTIMKLRQDGTFEVIATTGDERLGGEDWDEVLLAMIVEGYQKQGGPDPRENKELMQELRIKAVAAKETLSSAKQVEVAIADSETEFTVVITRPEFIARTRHLVARTQTTLDLMLEKLDWTWSHIDRPLMVGGSSRMPAIYMMLERCTQRALDRSLSPDTAIAMGAALFAAHRQGQKGLPLRDVLTVNSHPLGLKIKQAKTGKVINDVLLPANQQTEIKVTRTYRVQANMKSLTLTILNGDALNPDECVALGQGVIPKLPPDLAPDDRIEVTYCFQKNGLLQVEGTVQRQNGDPLKLTFEIQVEGRMTEQEVDLSRQTLKGFTSE